MSQQIDIDEEERIEISECDLDEGLDNMESWEKCSRCNRPCSGHKGSKGARCVMNPLNWEQLEEYYKELKTRIKGKKNKTPKRDPRTISASPAPYLTGNNPGGSTSAEPRLIQQLVTALRGISSVTPNPSDSQGGVRERSEFISQCDPTPNMNPQQWHTRQEEILS